MPQLSVGEQAADLILARRAGSAATITAALYGEMPHLQEKYGEYGRARCLEDAAYNLEHLAAAVALGSPSVFVNYIQWVDGLLRARNVPTEELIRLLQIMREHIGTILPAEGVEATDRCLVAGIEALEG